MDYKFLIALFTGFILLSGTGLSQETTNEVDTVDANLPKVVQFSGVLVTGDSLLPVPYSNVYRQKTFTGVVSNMLGFFTLPAMEGDTIVFSNVGYQTGYYVIPEGLDQSVHNIVKVLAPDTVMLAETKVYPWPSKDKFKDEFLALELPDDNLARMQKNLDPVEMGKRIKFLKADGTSAAQFAMNREVLQLQSMGTAQNISLMNPLAWAQFISALRNGSLKRD